MTHGGPLHNDLGKSRLAAHITEVDHGRNGAILYPSPAVVRRWRLEEMLRTHRELHEDNSSVPAVRDAAWPTAPGIPVPDAFDDLAASRTAGDEDGTPGRNATSPHPT